MLWARLRKMITVPAICVVAGCSASSAHTAADATGAIRSTTRTTGSVTGTGTGTGTVTGTGTATATATAPTSATARATVPTAGGAGYSAALSAQLLTKDSVPSGFTVQIATVEPTEAGDQPPPAGVPCSATMAPLLSATRLIGTPSAMAAATISNDPAAGDLWVGSEVLRTYAGDGAEQALTDLRSLISRCPSVDSFRFAVSRGPQTGDDSVHVSCSMTASFGALECNSVIVRVGSALVAVQEQGNESSGDGYLNQLAEAAVRRYQATSS